MRRWSPSGPSTQLLGLALSLPKCVFRLFIEVLSVCMCVCSACENIDGDQLATVKLLPAVNECGC